MKNRTKYHPNSEFVTVVFSREFMPTHIWGKKRFLRQLGIVVTNGDGKENWNWDYENPIIEIPDKRFKVEIDWNEKRDCCDMVFENGVVFGYVHPEDFVEISKIMK